MGALRGAKARKEGVDMIEPKVGDTIWVFDENHRVYSKDDDGRSFGRPIWREYWRKRTITGENRRSWLISGGGKCPKKRGYWDKRTFAFSEVEIDELEWEETHAHQIRRAVSNMTDKNEATIAKLKAIAEIIGYKSGEVSQ
jgi:hypothetical protein